MAVTPSNTQLPLHSKAPDFQLRDTISGKMITLSKMPPSKATVIMFICNHCPYVQHIQPKLISMAKQHQTKGISFIAISSNDANQYPDDGPDEMKKEALEKNFPFPYLYDETQTVASAYHAACTPEFYVFNDEMTLAYHGCFDSATPGRPDPITGKDLCAALDALLNHHPVPEKQAPSVGCNIKWKTSRK